MKIKDFQASKPQKLKIFGSRKSKDFQGLDNFDSFRTESSDSSKTKSFGSRQKHKVFETFKFLNKIEKIQIWH